MNAFLKSILKDLPVEVRAAFDSELKHLEQDVVTSQVAKSVAHVIAKGIDGVIAASVKTLGKGDAQKLTAAYIAEITRQVAEFTDAIAAYAPKQLAVELAKATFGESSKEVSFARADRQIVLDSFRNEVKQLLLHVVGQS